VSPKRIQRKRTKGWRMPQGAIYVGRPSKWGNPWAIDDPKIGRRPDDSPWDIDDLLRWYRGYVRAVEADHPGWLAPLRGHDLACWCPLDQPCHAAVLLELANPSHAP
jgi:hypothetical protein